MSQDRKMFSRMVMSLFFVLALTVMLGCRECNLYKYKPVEFDIFGGNMVVAVEGAYGQNYSDGGKKYVDFGHPYTLQFMLSIPYEKEVSGLKIVNIEIIGDKSKKITKLPELQSNKVNDPRARTDPNAEARTIIASLGGLTANNFSYETYHLSADVILTKKDDSDSKEAISITLEAIKSKERRSDWLDGFMGI